VPCRHSPPPGSSNAFVSAPLRLAGVGAPGLGEKLQSFEAEAEKLAVLALEQPDELNTVQRKMKELIKEIKTEQVWLRANRGIDIALSVDTLTCTRTQESMATQFHWRNDADAVAQRFSSILKYIQENYDLVNRSFPLYFLVN